jgi:hypothetical protein
MLALDTSSFLPPDLARTIAGYPDWLVVAVGILAAIVLLWILGKLLKWTLYLILIGAAVGGIGFAIWMVLNALHLLPGRPPSP